MYQQNLFGNVGPLTSTLSAAGSPAKTSVAQAKERASRAAARVYGERCLGLSAKSDPVGYSLRMFLRSSCEALTGYSLRWKESATPSGHWWLALGRSARRTKGTECGSSESWPTVHGNQGNNGPSGTELGNAVNSAGPTNWATPDCGESLSGHGARGVARCGNSQSARSLEAMAQWPTPQSVPESEASHNQLSGNFRTAMEQAMAWPTPNIPNRGAELDKSHRPNSGGIDLQSTVTMEELGDPHKCPGCAWFGLRASHEPPCPKCGTILENVAITPKMGPHAGEIFNFDAQCWPSQIPPEEEDNWATPSETDYKGSVSAERAAESTRGVRLPEQLTREVEWPTPASQTTAGEHMRTKTWQPGEKPKDADGNPIQTALSTIVKLDIIGGPHDQDRRNMGGKARGSLSATWVASLMGFPQEYSDELIRLCCECSETPGHTRTPC